MLICPASVSDAGKSADFRIGVYDDAGEGAWLKSTIADRSHRRTAKKMATVEPGCPVGAFASSHSAIATPLDFFEALCSHFDLEGSAPRQSGLKLALD